MGNCLLKSVHFISTVLAKRSSNGIQQDNPLALGTPAPIHRTVQFEKIDRPFSIIGQAVVGVQAFTAFDIAAQFRRALTVPLIPSRYLQRNPIFRTLRDSGGDGRTAQPTLG